MKRLPATLGLRFANYWNRGRRLGQSPLRADRFPASFHVDLRLLKKGLGAQDVHLASEHEFRGFFPDCETGAMPPFGNLYGLDVFADETLAQDREITFNAGSHRELIRLAWEDFRRLVEPKIMRLVREKAAASAA